MSAKKTKNEAIALELERFEAKIKEFPEYLETYDVTSKTDGVMTVASKRHQEIQCQIKIMDALPTWLAGLKKLKEDSETAEPEYRGDQVPNGLMKNKS